MTPSSTDVVRFDVVRYDGSMPIGQVNQLIQRIHMSVYVIHTQQNPHNHGYRTIKGIQIKPKSELPNCLFGTAIGAW